MKRLLFALVLAAAPAHAQLVTPLNSGVDTSALATKAQVDAATAAAAAAAAKADAVTAAMPQPATTVGPGEVVGGSVGTSMRYKREDWVPPRRSRTGSCVLPASGICTAPWTTAFNAGETPVMLGDPVATNTAALQPINCNVTGPPTLTGVPVKCWQAQATVLGATLLSIANLSVNPFGTGTLAGVTVTVGAIPASQ